MKKIVIHGVHRSGTSVTSNILYEAGCWYADESERMPPQEDNPNGFWERLDVVELNDSILGAVNLNWFTLVSEIPADLLGTLDREFGVEIKDILEKLNLHDDWFLKDPRFSVTWPLWKKYLQPTHHIIVYRHPVLVAKSLHSRNAIPIKQGLVFWFHQMKMIASALKDENNVFKVEFSSDPGIYERSKVVLNEILSGGETHQSAVQSSFDDVFKKDLIHHKDIDESLLNETPVILDAWKLVQQGKISELLTLPVFEPQFFQWDELDSRQAILNEREKAANEVLSYQNELKDIQQKANDQYMHIESLDKQVASLDKQVRSLNEHRDELNRSLISIAGKAKHLIESKSYMIFSFISKLMARLRLGSAKTQLHEIFDIAKYGHSIQDLESVLPKPTNRKMLLKAFVKNPVSFFKRITFKRLLRGFRTLLGMQEDDLVMKQALLQYQGIDGGFSRELDVFDPENPEDWAIDSLKFEKCDKPVVSIVVPVYNNYLMTLSCLHSIHKNTDFNSINFEIIIADDCSTDQTKDIETLVKGVRAVRGAENLGFLRNCNAAVPQAKGEYIVLLNNDTNVQASWLEALIEPLTLDNNIGVTGPMFLYPDGRLQEAGGIIFTDASGWNYGRFDQPDKPEYNFARDVDFVSGACLVFRKSLWDQVGGFDRQFAPAYYEDADFCFEMRKLGKKIRYIPTSKVVHFEGVSHGTSEDSGIKKYQVSNRKKFLSKWRSILTKAHCNGPDSLFIAREHGVNKKVLLFIDHYVPFHDQDTGSKMTKGYIDLFIKEGVKVIFLGENFYPHEPYTSQLQASGVEVLYGEYYKQNWTSWLKNNSEFIDGIYLNRPHVAMNFIDKIRALEQCPRLSYNPIDLHYLRVARQESLGVVGENGGYTSEQWKTIELELMRQCDVSFYFSDVEVDAVKQLDDSINAQPILMYWFNEEVLTAKRPLIKEANLLFVGGFGHPPNRDGLEWFLETIYPHVIREVPNVHLTVIGSKCPDEVFALANDNITVLGQVSEQVLEEEYENTRVAVVPLRYGAGVKGKVIESMKFQVNVLTTSIGSEGLPGVPSNYLTIADEEDDYVTQLVALIKDDDYCVTKQLAIREAMREHFSEEAAKAIMPMMGISR